MSQPLKTFICYAHEDHEVVEGLKKQLAIFEKKGLLQIWSDGKILAGEHWDKSIKVQLEQAEIILLFISVDFINSDYVEKTELQAALLRHRNGEATLIPIIVRHCHWEEYFDIGQFQALPAKARPILSVHFPHRDEAFFEIASGVKKTAEEIREQKLAALAAEVKRAEEAAAAKAMAAKEAAIRAEAEAAAKKEAELKAAQLAATAKLQRSKDLAAWKAAIEVNTIEAFEDYLEKYTIHEAEAHERIGKLEEIEAKHRAEKKAKEKAEALAAAAKALAAKEAAKEKAAEDAARKKRAEEEATRPADPFQNLMIPVKGGTFEMGSTEVDWEQPIHKVILLDFQLCKYLVNQAQWKAIMGENPSNFKGDYLPVEQVSWDDAQVFIKKLNEKTGNKYRLPTEVEWEFAARGGTSSQGYKYAGSNDLKEVGWYWENSGDRVLSGTWEYGKATKNNCRTHPVGQKKPNELGLYDMSGNVWEWVEDDWHDSYKGAPDKGLAWVDNPQGPSRVARGGSWLIEAHRCRAAYRGHWRPDSRYSSLGFRLALSL